MKILLHERLLDYYYDHSEAYVQLFAVIEKNDLHHFEIQIFADFEASEWEEVSDNDFDWAVDRFNELYEKYN